jgi:hypothetical protein
MDIATPVPGGSFLREVGARDAVATSFSRPERILMQSAKSCSARTGVYILRVRHEDAGRAR